VGAEEKLALEFTAAGEVVVCLFEVEVLLDILADEETTFFCQFFER
jgi:hypothetical protein